MISPTTLRLTHRLTLTGVLVSLLPFPLLTVMVLRMVGPQQPAPHPAFSRPGLTISDLDRGVDAAYRTVEFSEQQLAQTVSLAGRMLANERGIKQSRSHLVTWQVSGSHPVRLPALIIRKTPLMPQSHARHSFVNDFGAASEMQCSIFQRMNEDGDMLLVATTGQHASGTVMPAREAAVRAALARRSYSSAGATGAGSFSAYQPISRGDSAVIGMLAVSVPEAAEVEKIRATLAEIHIGAPSEVFAKGTNLPVPVDAAKKQPLRIVEERYRSASMGEMVARVRYFAPWDWVVGVIVPESEMAVTTGPPREPEHHTGTALAIALLISLSVSAAIWWRCARSLVSVIRSAETKIKHQAERLAAFGARTAPESRPASEGGALIATLKRAANLVISSSRETMLEIRSCREDASQAGRELKAMQVAMAEFNANSLQIGSVAKEITGIGMQSRILALNANIEAARAGHHGTAFGVVAEEFGNLAVRCTESANSISELLKKSVSLSNAGAEHLVRLGAEVERFSRRSERAAQPLGLVLEAATQQTNTISSLERSLVPDEPKVDTASALMEAFSTEADALEQTVTEIAVLVNGTAKGNDSTGREPTLRSFGGKAPAGSRSAHQAC